MEETLYRLCKTCSGTGQVSNDKAVSLQFKSLPCPECRLLRVVPSPDLSRDDLGRIVREAWCGWAKNQPQSRMKDSWLVPFDELNESDKEVDRLIGEAVVRRLIVEKS